MNSAMFEHAAIRSMEHKAISLGVNGVAGILTTDDSQVLEPMVYDPTLVVCGEKPFDVNGRVNFLSVVFMKIAQMVRTGMSSGESKQPLFGETVYRGGTLRRVYNLTVFTAFSGGTEKQDLEIAEVGLQTFEKVVEAHMAERKIVLQAVLSAFEKTAGPLGPIDFDDYVLFIR